MVDFVIAGLVLRDSILGIRLSFKPSWYRSHLLCIARNAYVLSGHVERVTRRQISVSDLTVVHRRVQHQIRLI